LASVSVFLLLTGEASAQEIPVGQNGRFAFSVEHLFGFVHSETSQDNAGVKTSNFANGLNLLGTPIGGAPISYSWPRLGFDLFLPRGLSLGTSISYFHGSGYSSNGSANAFQIAPRVGEVPLMGPNVELWARLGFTYDYISLGSVTESVYALSADLTFAVVLAPRIALTISPIADVPLGGTQKDNANNTSIATKLSDVGIEFGIVFAL
jgi:hypothetical protein